MEEKKKKSTAFPSLLVLSSSKYLEGSQQHRRLKQSSLANWSIDPDRATGGIITTEKSRKRKAWPVWYLVPYQVPVIRRLQHIFGPFFFSFFFLSIPFILPLPFCSLSLLVVAQMRGHIAGSSPPLPTTVRAALHFLSREDFSSFFELMDQHYKHLRATTGPPGRPDIKIPLRRVSIIYHT